MLAGLTLAVAAPAAAAAVGGFALLGLGLAVLLPVIFSTAGHRSGDAGPVLIGWSAQAIGLRTTLGALLVVLTAVLAVGRRSLQP